MSLSLNFARILFGILSTFFMITYMISYPVGSLPLKVLTGICLGGTFTLVLIGFDTFFKRYNLRIFNTAIVGLFFGYLMGQALLLIFGAILQITALTMTVNPATIDIIKISMFLFGTYIGYVLTVRFAEEIHISIPFVRFNHSVQKKKDLILDLTALNDLRFIDFCSTGVLNNQLILPKFILKHLNSQLETGDETTKLRARKTLEIIKKLQTIPNLGLRSNETDFPETYEIQQKSLRLARVLDANILLSDGNRVGMPSTDDILFVNLHSLSQCLKPLSPPGENITIKVQRYGKEPKQGVGYLDDGTMVVINNGGDFIGEIIDTQVISVKQTSAGRIIFTNAVVEDLDLQPTNQTYDHQNIYEHQHE